MFDCLVIQKPLEQHFDTQRTTLECVIFVLDAFLTLPLHVRFAYTMVCKLGLQERFCTAGRPQRSLYDVARASVQATMPVSDPARKRPSPSGAASGARQVRFGIKKVRFGIKTGAFYGQEQKML